MVIEEGDPYLVEGRARRASRSKASRRCFRFGELNVDRVRRSATGDYRRSRSRFPASRPALCPAARTAPSSGAKNLNCIVAGDIGCYSLGVLPPFEAMDTWSAWARPSAWGWACATSLPPEEAKRVVSVLGDSTFIHSGITGLVEMVYNPPATGHVVLILDNGTTAMTGMQEHPGTGRTLDHAKTGKVIFEDLARSLRAPLGPRCRSMISIAGGHPPCSSDPRTKPRHVLTTGNVERPR